LRNKARDQFAEMDETLYVERWLTFTLADGRWDIQLWPDSAKPVSGKTYRLTVRVPDELIGEAEAAAEISMKPQDAEARVEG
jgi:hypothetical protein